MTPQISSAWTKQNATTRENSRVDVAHRKQLAAIRLSGVREPSAPFPRGLSYRAISDPPEPNYRPVFRTLKVGNRSRTGDSPEKSDLPVPESTREARLGRIRPHYKFRAVQKTTLQLNSHDHRAGCFSQVARHPLLVYRSLGDAVHQPDKQ